MSGRYSGSRAVWATALVASILFSFALASQAKAAMPGHNGIVTYDGYDPAIRTSSINAVRADGSGEGLFGTLTGSPTDPAPSPDDSKIAYVRDGDVHVADNDGSRVGDVVLPRFAPPSGLYDFGAREPAWSPDGSKIALLRDPAAAQRLRIENQVSRRPSRDCICGPVDDRVAARADYARLDDPRRGAVLDHVQPAKRPPDEAAELGGERTGRVAGTGPSGGRATCVVGIVDALQPRLRVAARGRRSRRSRCGRRRSRRSR